MRNWHRECGERERGSVFWLLLPAVIALLLGVYWSYQTEVKEAQRGAQEKAQARLEALVSDWNGSLLRDLERAVQRLPEQVTPDDDILVAYFVDSRRVHPAMATVVHLEDTLGSAEDDRLRAIWELYRTGQRELVAQSLATMGETGSGFGDALIRYLDLQLDENRITAQALRETYATHGEFLVTAHSVDLLMDAAAQASATRDQDLMKSCEDAIVSHLIPLLESDDAVVHSWIQIVTSRIETFDEPTADRIKLAASRFAGWRERLKALEHRLGALPIPGMAEGHIPVLLGDVVGVMDQVPLRLQSGEDLVRIAFPPPLDSISLHLDVRVVRQVDSTGLDRVASSLEPFYPGHRATMEVKAPTGVPVRTLVTSALLAVGLLLTLLAVSRLQQLARARQKEAEEKTEFLATVSHQLKTPVANLRLFTETLANQKDIAENDRGRMLTILSDESQRLDDQLSRVLRLTSLESELNHRQDDMRALDLAGWLRQEATHWRTDAQTSGQAFQLDAPDDEVQAQASETLLRDVLDNLVSNGLKAGRPGDVLTMSLRQEPEFVRIRVQDHGAGIPSEIRDQIWSRFVRGAESRRSGSGAGLGLAIASAAANRMRARLSVEGTGPEGTTMVVTLRNAP